MDIIMVDLWSMNFHIRSSQKNARKDNNQSTFASSDSG